MKKHYVAVIGGSNVDVVQHKDIAEAAYQTGVLLAEKKFTVVCGGMTGVMQHVSRGVYDAGGTVIGILPCSEKEDGNPYLTYSIPTGLGHARNAVIINTADAVIAIDGKYGTLSEIAFALNKEIPIASIGSWDILSDDEVKQCKNPYEAVYFIIERLRISEND